MKLTNQFLLAALVVAMASGASAQLLDTTAITDQFTTGSRGNENGTGTFADSTTDGLQFADYNGADVTGGPITYINTYAAPAAPGETPVSDVTAVGNPDRNLLTTTIPQNTRPGATSPDKVILVSDDGGQNSLVFGDQASANYFVEVDVYAYDKSAEVGSEYEVAIVAVRAARDGVALTGGAYVLDREPSYALVYFYQQKVVRALRFQTGTTTAQLFTRTLAGGAWAEQYGADFPIATAGWHTFRVEANGVGVRFLVDGTPIATATDGTVANGRAGLGYREANVLSANEFAATFDNLKAGPFSVIGDWNMY